jgi:Xaa-Pro dipeptidase
VTLAATYPAHLAYLQRGYEAALAAYGFDAVVLCSGAAASPSRFDDRSWPVAWPVAPTPAFAHWCPLEAPDAFIVVVPGKRPTLVRTIAADFWQAPTTVEGHPMWSCFKVVEVEPGLAANALPDGKLAVITRDVGTPLPGAINPPELALALELLRAKKTDYEIECLAEANRRAARGHKQTAALFGTGTPSELDLHLAYLAASEQDDPWTPYKGIVALGPHAAVLHHVAYTRERIAGDTSLLVDAGAKRLGYSSDITRTHVRGNGAAARWFGELVDHIEALQAELIRRITPGLSYEDLHDDAHRLLAVALREIGIGRGSPDELVDRGVTRALFPHGLGHSLGVAVHDAGMKPRPPRAENKLLRTTSVIEPGQVFTIEPGIYVIDRLLAPLASDDRRRLLDWAAIDELRPFGGIRVEDDVVVEPRGIRNLTREAFAQA